MIAEVPTITIDLVTITQNTTPVHDEQLTHRLGLIPFVSDDTHTFKKYYECGCDNGCSNCNIKFELNVDQIAEEEMVDNNIKLVTVDQLRLVESKECSNNKNIRPFVHKCLEEVDAEVKKEVQENRGIVIMKLKKDHGIIADCIARKSIGKDHTKWSPAVACTFRQLPKVTINQNKVKKLSKREKQGIVNSCPVGVYEYKEHDDSIEVLHESKCTFCQECLFQTERTLDKPGLLTIQADQATFEFELESTGHLKPENIVMYALRILNEKFQTVKNGIQEELDRTKEKDKYMDVDQ